MDALPRTPPAVSSHPTPSAYTADPSCRLRLSRHCEAMHHAFQPPRHLGFVPPAPAPVDPGFFTCAGPAARQLPTSPAIAAPLGSTLCGPSRLGNPLSLPRSPTRPNPIPFHGPPRSTLPACPTRLSGPPRSPLQPATFDSPARPDRLSRPALIACPGPPRTLVTALIDHFSRPALIAPPGPSNP